MFYLQLTLKVQYHRLMMEKKQEINVYSTGLLLGTQSLFSEEGVGV